ncbi:hypothetical protein NJB1808e29_25070 [Mycobacterium marinum]|nr:hypothetical protein NJB1808e29_25070 [Mycobacterium marinum]GJP20928.1 hypothetical protein NJB1808_15810 [Mycobacterium marinum]
MVSRDAFAGMSRREFMAKATGVGAGAFLTDWAAPVIEKAYAAGPCSGHLTDIEHIVLCLQENRSFDHYFGSLSSVDGFDTPTSLFQQKGWDPRTQSGRSGQYHGALSHRYDPGSQGAGVVDQPARELGN